MVVELAVSGLSALVQPTVIFFLYWILEAIPTIFSIWGKGDRKNDEEDFQNLLRDKRSNTFDFIVVGAGTAGALVANRLVRNLHSVLLLEAGGEPMPLQYIPQFNVLLLNYPETDWMHRTVTQTRACLNSVNGQSSWSAGKVLGGSGTVNGLIHLRGHWRDFDLWANVTGDTTWGWNGVLPYFKKHEDYHLPGQQAYHGYGGDLRITQTDYESVANEFIEAGGELGYPNVDVNGFYQEAGFDFIRYPMRDGRRMASYKAFLDPIKYNPLLTLVKYALVRKVLFNGEREAYGVEYDRHGKMISAYAKKEVILCAGTMGSSKILMLSGVGPKEQLEEFNIPVISDLSVGENLQDHLGVYLSPFFINPPLSVNLERDITPSAFVKYLTLGTGPLSSAGPIATGLWPSKYAVERGEGSWPDIHIMLICYTMFRGAGRYNAHAYNLKEDEMLKYYEHATDKDACHFLVSGARPFSRGYLKLGGNSPYDKLVIEPNYLGDKDDMDFKVLLEAVKGTVYLMENTTAMGAKVGARFTNEKLPGCEHLEMRTDSYWECFIRRYSVTLHHPVGTVSMGKVVDTRLRVKGVQNLRVIDASVQPVIVTTNTQASALMIGEKGVDIVLKYWSKVGKEEIGVRRSGEKKPGKVAKRRV